MNSISSSTAPRVGGTLAARDQESVFRNRVKERVALGRLIGKSPIFLAETAKIPLLAGCDVTALICGETGTGKEMVARAIHYLSSRSGVGFVPINCGAIPAELVENELFGHERGAFTGATTSRAGLLEEAAGGTLLLDEVDSLPATSQVKLLRFLQEKEFRRLGSTRTRHSDVRVIAATNADVEETVRSGKLRRDFYYRLNVVPVHLPPLRQRREDVELLVRHFLERFAREYASTVTGFDEEAMAALVGYDWPGNVRELKHIVQRAVVLAQQRDHIRRRDTLLPAATRTEAGRVSFREAKARVVSRFERSYVEQMLALHAGNVTRAAAAADKNRRAFWELIRKHEIDVGRFRAA